MHGQLFGMLDQRVLTRWIHDKGFRKDVCNFIDAIVTTEIPDAILEKSQHFDRKTPVLPLYLTLLLKSFLLIVPFVDYA